MTEDLEAEITIRTISIISSKGRRPYPLCHAYRQMDDCGWVGQALGR